MKLKAKYVPTLLPNGITMRECESLDEVASMIEASGEPFEHVDIRTLYVVDDAPDAPVAAASAAGTTATTQAASAAPSEPQTADIPITGGGGGNA